MPGALAVAGLAISFHVLNAVGRTWGRFAADMLGVSEEQRPGRGSVRVANLGRVSPPTRARDASGGDLPTGWGGKARVERYGPGELASEYEPGDFILAHRNRPIAGLISLGQKRRFRGADAVFAHWSHCAQIVDKDGAIVEAEALGVVKSPISKYRAKEFHLVRLGSEFDPDDRRRAVDYASSQIGSSFGYLALVGVSVYLLTGLPVRLMRRGHQICSELVVRALQAGGLLKDADPSLTLPADLAKSFKVRP